MESLGVADIGHRGRVYPHTKYPTTPSRPMGYEQFEFHHEMRSPIGRHCCNAAGSAGPDAGEGLLVGPAAELIVRHRDHSPSLQNITADYVSIVFLSDNCVILPSHIRWARRHGPNTKNQERGIICTWRHFDRRIAGHGRLRQRSCPNAFSRAAAHRLTCAMGGSAGAPALVGLRSSSMRVDRGPPPIAAWRWSWACSRQRPLSRDRSRDDGWCRRWFVSLKWRTTWARVS